jgi:sulfate permease, SulP family
MGRLRDFTRTLLKKHTPDLVGYSKHKFLDDVGAGVTVGIIALPLSLALAIATGVPPILGLYTAGFAGFLAALFSGSPYSVSGPAAAMVPILAAIIKEHGLGELPYIGILAALFLMLFAAVGIGRYIRKVPESVVLGFTAGVAFVLFAGQLNTFLGLHGLTAHEDFGSKLLDTISHLLALSLPTLAIGLATLAIIIFWPRVPRLGKIPATLVAVLVTTLITLAIGSLAQVATLGSAYGQLPLGLPSLFSFTPSHFLHSELWFPALEIASLVAVESLLCAVVADKLTKKRHMPNRELFAQGVGNIAVAMVGSIPSTAVIARTGTIIKSGAKTRVASLLHAVVVLAFVVALAPLAAYIPLTTLSAVLLVTAVKIAEVNTIRQFIREKSWRLSAVLATTMLLTIFVDLVTGVVAGLVLHLAFAAHNKLRSSRDNDGDLQLAEEEA